MQKTSLKSVYVHIPFCKSICSYCDFCKNFYDEKRVGQYLNALQKEIDDNYKGDVLNTIYVGGGTPSSLSLKNLKYLFEIIKKFNLSNNYEFTFECNYEDITDELLEFLKINRVNRLSIGIQTFHKKYEKILNRKIDKKEMITCVNLAKNYFDNISVDLMYALKGEGILDLKEDLKNIKKLDVNHVSTYSLIIEKHTNLSILNACEIDSDTQAKMYELIVKELLEDGYNHYEISNFSKPGFESKHNLTYWNNDEYYGFGAGASGFVNGIRYDNTKSVFNYIKGKNKIHQETVSYDNLIKDEIMLDLRKTNGINKQRFKNKFKVDVKKVFNLNSFFENGLLIEDKTNVFIPEKYLFVSNEIILEVLDTYHLE